jgi:hypothetical protein
VTKTVASLAIFIALLLAGSYLLFRSEPTEGIQHAIVLSQETHRVRASGPLRHSDTNLLYFADGNGKAVYLTGSHVWNDLQDIEPPLRMDCQSKWLEPGTELVSMFGFSNYLDFLTKENHNFIRLWSWEQAAWVSWLTSKLVIHPLPYARTGPGTALDGLPKFNVLQFDQDYFDRLRSRVSAAGERGIYVSVMLFQGWSIETKGLSGKNPWLGHPFNRANNVNGVDGDPNGDDKGTEDHTLQIAEITALQESYVRKVVATLNDLDNVLWEISNESDPISKDWQYHMINFLKRYEAGQPKQHPVGMTFCGETVDLFDSPADWVSPGCSQQKDYCKNPPPADGRKVIISDTDHLFGVGGDRAWVWKSFTRGLNPIFMDPLEMPQWEPVRQAMGLTLAYANRMDLSAMRPRGDLATSGYCLANPGKEYLVYLPFEAHKLESTRFIRRYKNKIMNFRWLFKRTVTVNLSDTLGEFLVEWCDPSSGEITTGSSITAGTKLSFKAPFKGDAVLYVRKKSRG